VLKALEFKAFEENCKVFQHRDHREKRRMNPIEVDRATNGPMIDEAQPFWRLRRRQESRKLGSGQEFVLEESPRNATGQIALSTKPSSMVRALVLAHIFWMGLQETA
jgi:hypothetical protein